MQSIRYIPFPGLATKSLIKGGWFVRRGNGDPLGELTEDNNGNISFRPEGRSITSAELAGFVHFIQAVKNRTETQNAR